MQASSTFTVPPLAQALKLTQKKFVDAVNGKSGLTFFDALESEVHHELRHTERRHHANDSAE